MPQAGKGVKKKEDRLAAKLGKERERQEAQMAKAAKRARDEGGGGKRKPKEAGQAAAAEAADGSKPAAKRCEAPLPLINIFKQSVCIEAIHGRTNALTIIPQIFYKTTVFLQLWSDRSLWRCV